MKQLNSKFNEHDQLSKALKRRSMLFQHFVQQFKSECLASLREHHVYQSKKQGSQEEIIKVGDVVLMHAGNVPRRLYIPLLTCALLHDCWHHYKQCHLSLFLHGMKAMFSALAMSNDEDRFR